MGYFERLVEKQPPDEAGIIASGKHSLEDIMEKVRWGVLSTAKIALEKVIPAMQQSPRCDIAAIASRDPQKAEAAAMRSEKAADRSEAAARSAEQSANKSEAMANKAESIFMHKMKK